nr:hypothetical protein [Candidatus Freyarchaeota archaeon]
MRVYLSKIFDHFKRPGEKTVEEILENIGVFESDESYEKLKTCLHNLMGRKSREISFSDFFGELSRELCKKIKKELSKNTEEVREKVRNETLQELKGQITRTKEQLTSEVITEAFSQEILTIIDRPTYLILKLLYEEEKSHESLRRTLNLGNSELMRRINYLEDIGFVKLCYSNNCVNYNLSDTAKTILERRGAEFERLIDLLVDDKAHQLSLEAVGGDKKIAEKFESWLRSTRGRAHFSVIQKLHKEYRNPKRVSQVFFGKEEMGVTQEKHIRIKIVDHRAAGERLLLEVEKFQKMANHYSKTTNDFIKSRERPPK